MYRLAIVAAVIATTFSMSAMANGQGSTAKEANESRKATPAEKARTSEWTEERRRAAKPMEMPQLTREDMDELKQRGGKK